MQARKQLTFRQFLAAVRKLNKSFSAHDAAQLCACVFAVTDSHAVATSQHETTPKGASMRMIVYYIAHRELAERIVLKYQLDYLVPNVIKSRKLSTLPIQIPLLSRLPTPQDLADMDWNRM